MTLFIRNYWKFQKKKLFFKEIFYEIFLLKISI